MTDTDKLEREHEQGEALGNALCIPKNRNGRWKTCLGDKTSVGLYHTVIGLTERAQEGVKDES